MKTYIYIFLATAGIFLIIDAVWLSLIALPIYQKDIGHLMKDLNYLPAILFYLIYVVGMIFFVIHPNLETFSLSNVLFSGFIFGIVCYATYDLTNMATLKDWTWQITLLDIAWGGTVTMVTTTLVTYVFKGV